ncbi:hypothetical protein AB0H76_02750 [Nocardia sp. NPDC050712]|uniref:hypothetical protein n=1 Tax=Nocardia sp. NPDC050712 TaxID=3155518 RepID=UPI0033C8AAD3
MRRLAAVTPFAAAVLAAIPALAACGPARHDAAPTAELVRQPETEMEHSPAAPAPTTMPISSVRIVNCLSQPRIRPSEIVLTCADANMIIDRMVWDSWTDSGAFGRGMESRSVCHPDCASAPRQSFPVAVELSAPVDGLFTTLTKTPDGGVPEVLPIPR